MAARQVDVLLAGIRDTSGEPLAAGKIYTYEAGTTTDKTTWTDIDKTTPAANPIILDSNGRALIFAEGAYKFVVKTSADSTVYTWDDLVYEGSDTNVYYSGNSTGSSNAYVLSNTIPISAYSAGQRFSFMPNFSNTSSATINIDSLGAKTIKHKNGSNLIGGEVAQNRLVTVQYDGTNLVLVEFNPAWTSWTSTSSASGSMTTSSDDVTIANFQNYGDRLDFIMVVKCTLGGTPSNIVYWTLPAAPVELRGVGFFSHGSTRIGGVYATYSSSTISFELFDGSNYTTGANRTWYITGTMKR